MPHQCPYSGTKGPLGLPCKNPDRAGVTVATHKYSFVIIPARQIERYDIRSRMCSIVARSISLYYTPPYNTNSIVIRPRWVDSEVKASAKNTADDGPTQKEETKTTKKGGGWGAWVAQDDAFNAPSSIRISASLSIFLSWVASRRSPRAAFSFKSSIAFS